MDRVQPVLTRQAEAFMPDQPHPSKPKVGSRELVLKIDELDDYPAEEDLPIVILTRHENEQQQQQKVKSPEKPLEVPKIIISNELNNFRTVSDFESINDVSKFVLSYTGRTTCKITNQNGLSLFKGKYPKSKCFEGWHSDLMEKHVEIVDEFQNSVVLKLRYVVPSCQVCFEEESTTIEILDPSDGLMATITQKKTWMNANIAREVYIKPGPHGVTDVYKAEFSWNDSSVNLKANRTGLIVANMLKECSKKGPDFTLQILKEIKPCDKAILVAFMMARDLLMIDEKQTRKAVDRVTIFFVLCLIGAIVLYFFT